LMPLRAFGDIRFKWPSEELKHVARLLDLPPNYPIMPAFYATPPYLCSTPQVVWRPLIKNRDHFLVLGTDGLWDMLSPKEVVNVVAQHWFDYNGDPSVCGPGDTAASRLIRTALGGDEMDPERISAHISMPATVARYYRDDITVVVVYLPTAAHSEPSR
uniref:PPM-type phosphatase domain-containing protein n=1 Tax=Echinostoma caproni TaxID=27848 RepID=A0A183ARX0_9TREM